MLLSRRSFARGQMITLITTVTFTAPVLKKAVYACIHVVQLLRNVKYDAESWTTFKSEDSATHSE